MPQRSFDHYGKGKLDLSSRTVDQSGGGNRDTETRFAIEADGAGTVVLVETVEESKNGSTQRSVSKKYRLSVTQLVEAMLQSGDPL